MYNLGKALIESTNTSSIMPTLFLAHGSPMLGLETPETDTYVRKLREIGETIQQPRAILMIGAHFMKNGKFVDISEKPETLYDYYGFPEELYRIRYSVHGFTEGYDMLKNALPETTFTPIKHGLDHGAWTVLKHLYPLGNIPVFSLSLDSNDSLQDVYTLGTQLRSLRSKGILILGNGNIVHNLRYIHPNKKSANIDEFASAFQNAFIQALQEENMEHLFNPHLLPFGRVATQTVEHYAPFLAILGAALPGENPVVLFDDFEHGNISRLSIGFV